MYDLLDDFLVTKFDLKQFLSYKIPSVHLKAIDIAICGIDQSGRRDIRRDFGTMLGEWMKPLFCFLRVTRTGKIEFRRVAFRGRAHSANANLLL